MKMTIDLGKHIHLQLHQIPVWNAMMDRFNNSKSKYNSKSGYYSRQFKKVVRLIGRGELHFHNLRDTYAVRRWAITGDIKLVSDEIGHTSVAVTEKYTKCNLRRLQSDFPSIADIIKRRLKKPIEDNYLIGVLNGKKQLGNGEMVR